MAKRIKAEISTENTETGSENGESIVPFRTTRAASVNMNEEVDLDEMVFVGTGHRGKTAHDYRAQLQSLDLDSLSNGKGISVRKCATLSTAGQTATIYRKAAKELNLPLAFKVAQDGQIVAIRV